MSFTCPLCKNIVDKLVISHIISKHHFKGNELLNSKTSYQLFNRESNKLTSIPIGKSQYRTGWYENLLCCQCDSVIIGNRLENYGSGILYDGKVGKGNQIVKQYIESLEFGSITEVTNINYIFFKNYLLSMLWRASISKLKEFAEINLGRMHEEELRKIIFNNAFTDDNKYRISMWACHDPKETDKQIITPFRKFKDENGLGYWYLITIGIYVYFFKIESESKIPDDDVHNKLRLKENGSILIKHIIRNDLFSLNAFPKRNGSS